MVARLPCRPFPSLHHQQEIKKGLFIAPLSLTYFVGE